MPPYIESPTPPRLSFSHPRDAQTSSRAHTYCLSTIRPSSLFLSGLPQDQTRHDPPRSLATTPPIVASVARHASTVGSSDAASKRRPEGRTLPQACTRPR